MEERKWTVLWKPNQDGVYLPGAKVDFGEDGTVSYENPLMPPGTVIKEWYSKTSYEKQKTEPSLPMIDGETTYLLTSKIECPDKQNFYIRLVFLDRYDKEIDDLIIREGKQKFKCPLATYSYTMQLLNGGLQILQFHWIQIQEVDK